MIPPSHNAIRLFLKFIYNNSAANHPHRRAMQKNQKASLSLTPIHQLPKKQKPSNTGSETLGLKSLTG